MKLKKFFPFFLIMISFLFVSCSKHNHTFSNEWSYDEYKHWHAANCEHENEKSCEMDHTWSIPTITKFATEEVNGEKTSVCSVCDAKKIETIPKLTHSHTFSESWSSDDTYHWHEATCTHIDEISNKQEHEWIIEPSRNIEICSICQRVSSNNMFLVSYVDYDGTIISVDEVQANSILVLTEYKPQRNNYRFDCWIYNGEKISNDVRINITNDVTIEARYIRQYKIDFIDYDGTTISDSLYIDEGDNFEYPTHPNREGYNSNGWSQPNENVTSDLVVEALYEIKYFDVKFYMPDGIQLGESQSIPWNHCAVAPELAPYFFTWNNNILGYENNTAYMDSKWSTEFSNVKENLNIYAKYETKVEGIVLICDSATISKDSITIGSNVTITSYIFSNDKTAYGLGISIDLVVLDENGNKTNNIYFNDELNGSGNYENLFKYNGYSQAIESIDEYIDEESDKILNFVWSSGRGNKISNYSAVFSITFTLVPNTPKGIYYFKILRDSYLIVDGMEKCEPTIISGQIIIV